MQQKVSDVITEENIQSWGKGSIITIEAGTGQGKSYFIKNKLYNYAKQKNKKILMLIHRVNCVNQFQAEIERDDKTDIIEIMTYQKLEYIYKNKGEFDFSEYEYLICDEYQFFVTDAAYNRFTDISLNVLLEQKEKTRIFMSATGNHMKLYLNKFKKLPIIEYKLPISHDTIRELIFFNSSDSLEVFMQSAIDNNFKSIFFIQSATKAYELHKKFKNYSLFNCGQSDKHYKYVDKEKINNMLVNERFEELILITTTCLDAGVNIIDETLNHILVDVKDLDVLKQCVGRKRSQHSEDKVQLVIKNISNQALGGIETQINKKLEMCEFLNEYTVKEFIEAYPREHDKYNIIYDDIVNEDDKCTKKINQLMRFKCKIDKHLISEMKSLGDFSYCKYVANEFGFYDGENYNYTISEEVKMKDDLENYLSSIVGKRLLKEDQKELIDKIQLKDKYGRIQKSIDLFNAYFVENELSYMVVSKRSSKMIDGKKKDYRYWEVINNVDLRT